MLMHITASRAREKAQASNSAIKVIIALVRRVDAVLPRGTFTLKEKGLPMFRLVSLVLALFLSALPATAEIVSKTSPYPVAETIDRLKAAVEKAGATVFARVDHAGGAAKIGDDLRPAQMLMFGNPKLGTPAMKAAISAGLDLPLRVLAYQDDNGTTQLIYHAPSSLSADHGVPADAEVIKKMTGALNKLTDAAVAK